LAPFSEEEVPVGAQEEEEVKVELVGEKSEAPEEAPAVEEERKEEEEEEIFEYDISSPELLEVMLDVTDVLERVAKGELTLSAAKAEYQLAVSKLEDVAKKTRSKRSRKKSSSSRRRKKKSSQG